MRSIRLVIISSFVFALLTSCASLPGGSVNAPTPPPAVEASPSPAPSDPTASPSPAPAAPASPAPALLAEIDGIMAKARDAVDAGHLAEAIRHYVSVIAIMEESPSAVTRGKAESAAAELARIGTRLTLEPASEWLDPKGSQVAGLSRAVGKEGALAPSVYLYESFGSGKAPVADAPIYFEFVANGGSLVSLVTTDAYGKANTTIARLDEPGKEAVIRAYPVFRSRGKAFSFKSVFRDFAYLPPANIARVVALETSELGASENPQIADAIAAALKPTGLQLAPYNASLAPDLFRAAFGGDPNALAAMGTDVSAPYLAFALVEIPEIRQTELNGKKYNIFTAMAKATFRLVRSDGTTVFGLPLEAVKGQGGSREAAAEDGYKRAREAMIPEIEKRIGAIKEALAKE